ncbi:uncharacterized protein LOC110900753 [Helianthus annuus]|uniref:uncharacterized protein LOC110900753 n=1 Tax=Helianthus annuus TaxID=4232 RepID=UPI0016533901|nr:uncharacterized protein LOC110900753 [Helianthus annuus]
MESKKASVWINWEVDGQVFQTFKDACFARGLLDDDKEYDNAVKEASTWSTGDFLRTFFVMLLLSNSISRPDLDLQQEELENICLSEIEKLLLTNGSTVRNFDDMPSVSDNCVSSSNNRLIMRELSYDRLALQREHDRYVKCLTAEQERIYKIVMEAIEKGDGGVFFVYGYGGTGKTFLWKTFSTALRSKGEVVLNVASSGIASLLLDGGRTAHSSTYDSQAKISICSIEPNKFLWDLTYFQQRAILAPTNEVVDSINKELLESLPGEEKVYFSSDSLCQSEEESELNMALFPPDVLNNICLSGLPNHKLVLKLGAPVMLLRNIDQANGLCNSTRLQITKLGKVVIEAKIITGTNIGHHTLISRLKMTPSDKRIPVKISRRQFPLSLCFAMTINKSQGQSLERVGLYLPRPVFSHGQLYIAISRVKSRKGLKILFCDKEKRVCTTTTNVVYKEVLQNL